MNTPSNYIWAGDLREVTGLGGSTELAARAAVSAAARYIDSLGDDAGPLMFSRNGEGAPVVPNSVQAEALDQVMREASKVFGGLTASEYVGTLRVVMMYYALAEGAYRWERFLATRAPIDGVCRYCGQPIEPESLTNWQHRTVCVRCFASRKFTPMGGAQC